METVPIWYVILTCNDSIYPYIVWQVAKSIACTMADTQAIYEKEVAPLYQHTTRIQTLLVMRDVPNPFNTHGVAANEEEIKVPIAALAEPSVWDI